MRYLVYYYGAKTHFFSGETQNAVPYFVANRIKKFIIFKQIKRRLKKKLFLYLYLINAVCFGVM